MIIIFIFSSVEHVDSRIEMFLQKFSKMLKKTNEKELAEVRSSLIRLKTLSDIHLKEEVSRNWEEIASNEYIFDRRMKEVNHFSNYKFINFFNNVFINVVFN